MPLPFPAACLRTCFGLTASSCTLSPATMSVRTTLICCSRSTRCGLTRRRYRAESYSPSRSCGWMTFLRIPTTTNDFRRRWAGGGCLACPCCETAIQSALSWLDGPRRDRYLKRAGRTAQDVRRPGGDRDRERAAIRRGAGTYARAERGAGTADCDSGRIAGDQPVPVRTAIVSSRPCWKLPARSATQSTGRCTVGRVTAFELSQRTASPPSFIADLQGQSITPGPGSLVGRAAPERSRSFISRTSLGRIPNDTADAIAQQARRRSNHPSRSTAARKANPIGVIAIYRAGSTAVHRKADRAARRLSPTRR